MIKSIIELDGEILCIFGDVFPINLFELLFCCREQDENLTSIMFKQNLVLEVSKNAETNFVNETPFLLYKPVINQVNRI